MSPNVEDKPSYDDKMSCEIIALPNNYLVTAERASFSTKKCRQIANPSTNEGSTKIVSVRFKCWYMWDVDQIMHEVWDKSSSIFCDI